MKIGFIARGLTRGGVTRYIENFLRTFDSSFATKNSLVLFTDRKDLQTIYKNIQVIYIKKSNKVFWDYIKILPYLLKMKLDVVFYPKNIIPFTHVLFKFKKINIIHDLAYFDNNLNEYKTLDTLYMKVFMKLSCLIANKIIAVSNATKKDIENILKISSDKIYVVHEGIEDQFKRQKNNLLIQQTLSKYNIQKPFMFYCGSLSPRKNILRTLMAFNEIKNKIPHNVYLAGGQSWHDKEVWKYIKTKLADRVFAIGYVSEDELINLYSSADLYLYASLYEGFGLPILEAQACGCPVITSNRTSCPEVAGKGAIIVDPYNIEEIKKSILKMSSNGSHREEIIKKGFLNVKKYSWSRTVNKLGIICNEIYNE